MAEKQLSRRSFLAAAVSGLALPYAMSEEAQAQDLSPRQLRNYGIGFRSMGRLWHSGILPARNVRDLRFQIGMGNFQHFLADHTFARAHDRQLEIIVHEIRNNRQLQTQVRRIDLDDVPQTFVSAGWNDRDKDRLYHFSELVDANEPTYDSSDKEIQFGMYMPIPGVRGRSYKMQLLGPDGKTIKPRVGRIGRDFVTEHESEDPRDLIDEFGQGKYKARFCLDGKLWDERTFCLEDKRKRGKNNNLAWNQFDSKYPATFVSTGSNDLDGNGLKSLREYDDPNQKVYVEGDRLYGVAASRLDKPVKVHARLAGEGFKTIREWEDTLGPERTAPMDLGKLPAGDYIFAVQYDGSKDSQYHAFTVGSPREARTSQKRSRFAITPGTK